MLAAIFAANGYVVVSPDYIGLGAILQFLIHIFFILAIMFQMVEICLLPHMSICKPRNCFLPLDNKTILPLFVSGYSEGASYALWFSRIYQSEPDFAKNSYSIETEIA